MTGYRIRLLAFDEAGEPQRQQAERRYGVALEAALGDACLVAPVYRQVLRLYALHGPSPDLQSLSEAEAQLLQTWQEAEAAALTAALGPHRYLEEAQFEILIEE
jgi:hypothetical protein